MGGKVFLIAIGVNHRTAPVEVREKLAFGKNELPTVLLELKQLQAIGGVVVLSTCNRTEVYAAVGELDRGLAVIRGYLCKKAGLAEQDALRYLQSWTCYDCVKHLFRVAAGLDSMVLGEAEILGQVRDAYEMACRLKTGNSVINTLFQEAIKVGKRVRTQTGIDRHPVSVSSVAVDLVRQELGGDLRGRTVLIIGAGEMGELTLKNLVARGVSSVLVSNRSFDRAVMLAREYGGKAIRYDEFYDYLKLADIVIACTSAAHFVVSADKVEKVIGDRRGRPLFFIDIAVPRDVEPSVGEIPGVYLYDIDDLERVVSESLEERKKAAVAAEEIISEAVRDFLKWLNTLTVLPTIKALKEKFNTIKEEELRRCLKRLGSCDPSAEEVISSMANSIVNKLLHEPIARLKEYASRHEGHLYSKVLENLFGLVSSEEAKIAESEEVASK